MCGTDPGFGDWSLYNLRAHYKKRHIKLGLQAHASEKSWGWSFIEFPEIYLYSEMWFCALVSSIQGPNPSLKGSWDLWKWLHLAHGNLATLSNLELKKKKKKKVSLRIFIVYALSVCSPRDILGIICQSSLLGGHLLWGLVSLKVRLPKIQDIQLN